MLMNAEVCRLTGVWYLTKLSIDIGTFREILSPMQRLGEAKLSFLTN